MDTSNTDDVDTSNTEDFFKLQIKAECFDWLIQLIKEKLSTIKTNKEIIQVLILAPETWSFKKVANFFNVTEYAAFKARSLVQEKGIFALTDKKEGKTYLEMQLIWLQHSMKTMNFFNKCLEKRSCYCFLQYPQTKTMNSFKFKWTLCQ